MVDPPALGPFGRNLKGVEGSAETRYITTAIHYTNGEPHIGHAYEDIVADVMARSYRAYG